MRKSVRTNLLSFFLLSFILVSSCKRSTAPLTDPANLQLTVQDVSCTEAWLRLKANPTFYGKTVTLFRGDSLAISRTLTAADTLLYTEGLQPAATYSFQAEVSESGRQLAASAAVTVTTMDTTSHNFTWQTFEFGGQGGSSSFYDVAIIDENDIWAVGEIYTADDKYNAAHWNGERWELKRIDWDGYVSRLTCVFAFSSNDVWFGVTNLIHWNGNKFEKNINPILNQFYNKTVNKIWGTSSSDLYVVGNSGLIAHYDGQQWQRIESGTDLPIQDIWGSHNKINKKNEIICIASKLDVGDFTEVIQIKNDKTVKLNNQGLPWSMRSLWFVSQRKYYTAGDGLFFIRNHTSTWQKYQNFIPIFIDRIRGTGFSDIIISGSNGLLSHFNGKTWKHYVKDELPYIYGHYYSANIKNNIVVAVGESYLKAAVVLGYRE